MSSESDPGHRKAESAWLVNAHSLTRLILRVTIIISHTIFIVGG